MADLNSVFIDNSKTSDASFGSTNKRLGGLIYQPKTVSSKYIFSVVSYLKQAGASQSVAEIFALFVATMSKRTSLSYFEVLEDMIQNNSANGIELDAAILETINSLSYGDKKYIVSSPIDYDDSYDHNLKYYTPISTEPPVRFGAYTASAYEEIAFSDYVGFYDPNNFELVVEVSDTPAWLSVNVVRDDTDINRIRQYVYLSGTPQQSDAGTAPTITINVTNTYGIGIEYSYAFTVSDVNDPVVITSTPPTIATEDTLFEYHITLEDPDVTQFDDTMVNYVGPSWLQVERISALQYRLYGTVPSTAFEDSTGGKYTIELTARDNRNSTDVQTFDVYIANGAA